MKSDEPCFTQKHHEHLMHNMALHATSVQELEHAVAVLRGVLAADNPRFKPGVFRAGALEAYYSTRSKEDQHD